MRCLSLSICVYVAFASMVSNMLDSISDSVNTALSNTQNFLNQFKLNHGNDLTDSSTISDEEAAAIAAEVAFDWTGWYEYSTFCPGNVCPVNTQCLNAPYTSTSGQKCRCSSGTELYYNYNNIAECTDYSSWIQYQYFCKNGNCPNHDFCVESLMLNNRMCTCEPGYQWEYKTLTKRYVCDKI